MSIEDGGSAFPVSGNSYISQNGISMRDWFATHAPPIPEDEINLEKVYDRNRNPYNDSHKPRQRSRLEIIADLNYEYADAMLAARLKKKKI